MGAEKIWTDTCRVVLGEELGPLGDYEKLLKRYVRQSAAGKSALSGKDLAYCDNCPGDAKFILADEAADYAKMLKGKKLDINSIKDIDSLVRALEENFYYAGNIVLGNSSEVTNSTDIISSSNVHFSEDVIGSKNVAHCSSVRFGENIVGTYHSGSSKFVLKSFRGFKCSRLFETVSLNFCSDCYYTVNLENCSNCLFSFNLRSKLRCIGNLELPQDKFASLKDKLVKEIAGTMRAKKTVPSITEIVHRGVWNE
ncbi:Uncharacterised protein [Candidatus Gugararchaeum adminiculabundum]|nr:Uncharacterised protein [Candidatus Gugararchaeum adminiculabundum]